MISNHQLQIECWDGKTGRTELRPLNVDSDSRARCSILPHERARHSVVKLHLDEKQLLLAIKAENNARIEVQAEIIAGKYRFDAGGYPLFYLPGNLGERIAAPLNPSAAKEKLDIALLIDGTVRNPNRGLLMDDTPARDALFQEIVASIAGSIGSDGYTDVAAAVVAFGDLPMTHLVQNSDLRPRYITWPDSPRFQKITAGEALLRRIREIRGSSGADQVDALGEGLRVCSGLAWRREARKILVLVGDSPGFSLREPPLPLSDIRAREVDVELEIEGLSAKGVEIMSVFSFLSHYKGDISLAAAPFIEQARQQYSKLASTAERSFEVAWNVSSRPTGDQQPGIEGLKQTDLYELIVQPDPSRWLGRGLCWAIFAE